MGKIIFDWKMLMNSFRRLNGLIRSVSVDKMIVDYEHITDKRHLEKHGLHKSEIRVAIENGVARICAGEPPIAYVPPIRRGVLELSRDIGALPTVDHVQFLIPCSDKAFLEMGIWNSNQIRISTSLTRDEVRWTYNQMIYQMDDCFQGALMDEKDIAREVLVLVKEGFGRAMLNLTKKF